LRREDFEIFKLGLQNRSPFVKKIVYDYVDSDASKSEKAPSDTATMQLSSNEVLICSLPSFPHLPTRVISYP